jgi:hypothetical protein
MTSEPKTYEDSVRELIDEDAFPFWKETFDDATRTEHIGEDLFASKTVCGLLTAVAAGGVMLGGLGVLLCWWLVNRM